MTRHLVRHAHSLVVSRSICVREDLACRDGLFVLQFQDCGQAYIGYTDGS